MQPMTAIWVGAGVLFTSVLRLVYRLILHTRATVEVRKKRHHRAEWVDAFLVLVELPDGTEEEVDVRESSYEGLEVGDTMEVAYYLGPKGWRASVYSGTRAAVALVPLMFMVLGIGLVIWGVVQTG